MADPKNPYTVASSGAIERSAESASDSQNSIAQLLGGLLADGQQLVRKEVELAKQEVKTEINKARDSAISLGIGIGVTAVGAMLLLLMLVNLLVEVAGLPYWVSYLIVGGILALVGGILLANGIAKLKQIDPVPHETIDSVKKDVEWLKEQSPSDKI